VTTSGAIAMSADKPQYPASYPKLFIPGPTDVHPYVLQAMATPMIGHRDKEFTVLYNRIQPRLQKLLGTKQPVFLASNSASGTMEAAVRNLSTKKILSCVCGAFSSKWADIAESNGKALTRLKVDWGQPITPEAVDAELSAHPGEYDLVTCVFNETSCGLRNPIPEIAKVVKKHPGVLFAVDAVSNLAGERFNTDEIGIDWLLAGVQKAFGLPPGLAVFTVSQAAIDRHTQVPNRGYYMDLSEFLSFHEKGQTPATPAISLIFALDAMLELVEREGLEQRFVRHETMYKIASEWVKERFAYFPAAGYESRTLACVSNTRNIDIKALNAFLSKEHGCVISNGYGKLKDKTFRISHMANETPETITQLLGWIDGWLDSNGGK
jgi:aspartate aminotransferase-like enzyme